MENCDKVYDELRLMLSPKAGVALPDNNQTAKLLTNMYTLEEAEIMVNGIRKAMRPVSVRKIRKRMNLPKDIAKNKLNEMKYKGKLVKLGPFCVVPPYLPGLFEVYFTHGRDDPERLKKAGEAHFELIKSGFHVEHTKKDYPLFRVLPAIEPTLKSVELNKEVEFSRDILPYEILEKYLSQQKTFAVQPCSCRHAAELAGDPCKRTDENFCISTGLLAKSLIKQDVAREVSLEELMEIMKKAEKEGLVHQTTNMQKTSLFMCNCCSCCCGFLKQMKELKNRRAVAFSNFQPIYHEDECVLCKKCVEICPMGTIEFKNDSPKGKIQINLDGCIGCGVCASNCPNNAIELQKVEEKTPVKGLLGVIRKLRKER